MARVKSIVEPHVSLVAALLCSTVQVNRAEGAYGARDRVAGRVNGSVASSWPTGRRRVFAATNGLGKKSSRVEWNTRSNYAVELRAAKGRREEIVPRTIRVLDRSIVLYRDRTISTASYRFALSVEGNPLVRSC